MQITDGNMEKHIVDSEDSDTLSNANILFQIFDRLFDIMNSRKPRAKGFKAPLAWAL